MGNYQTCDEKFFNEADFAMDRDILVPRLSESEFSNEDFGQKPSGSESMERDSFKRKSGDSYNVEGGSRDSGPRKPYHAKFNQNCSFNAEKIFWSKNIEEKFNQNDSYNESPEIADFDSENLTVTVSHKDEFVTCEDNADDMTSSFFTCVGGNPNQTLNSFGDRTKIFTDGKKDFLENEGRNLDSIFGKIFIDNELQSQED
jgi:antitoxin component YwqK of YwqJK toxin-antitoxin module